MTNNQLFYSYAEETNNWPLLINNKYLLWRWQQKHRPDVMKIATVASHRLGHHKWCGDKCTVVNNFIADKELLYQETTVKTMIRNFYRIRLLHLLTKVRILNAS